MAAIDLVSIRTLVQPPFATGFEFEVFHRVGDENHFAVNLGVLESFREHAARRTNKWFPLFAGALGDSLVQGMLDGLSTKLPILPALVGVILNAQNVGWMDSRQHVAAIS